MIIDEFIKSILKNDLLNGSKLANKVFIPLKIDVKIGIFFTFSIWTVYNYLSSS